MCKKWKESEFFKKMKQVRVNRAIYLSAVVILLSLAVVLAITAATNRAKKNPGSEDPTPEVTTPAIDPPGGTETETKPQEQPTVKDEVIPELSLPVSGKLTNKHSVDVQVFSQTMQNWRVHLGIDIHTEANAPVCAAADGKVEQIWEDPMMGWCVALSHTGDCVTVYKNLAKDLADTLTVGKEVQKGELLGYVGDTALLEIAEEPHLHMEMTVKGLQVDPLEYFSTSVLNSLKSDTGYEPSTGK
ncbi:MAG: M23 family metallopeptidase [Clostridia bacterium]|nr:M23 family metallopeptidase [Clostridia bacterium]